MIKIDDPIVKYLVQTFNMCLDRPGDTVTFIDTKFGLKMELYKHANSK